MPEQRCRCSHLLTIRKRTQLTLSLAMHPILRENEDKRGPCPESKRAEVSSPPKHRHDRYKSLAGGLRCVCEVWRSEFMAERNQYDSAAEQGRRYCLAHSTPGTQ
jgi:hypothetical protein